MRTWTPRSTCWSNVSSRGSDAKQPRVLSRFQNIDGWGRRREPRVAREAPFIVDQILERTKVASRPGSSRRPAA